MRRFGWLIVLPLLALSACGDDARISITSSLDSPLSTEMLTVSVRDVNRLIRFTGADFRTDADHSNPTTPEVGTATSGPDLELSYTLESAGAILSSGTFTIPRRSDWRWNVSFWAATTNPMESCFGCFGFATFPLAETARTPGRDSIWVVWGGNSISDPVIY